MRSVPHQENSDSANIYISHLVELKLERLGNRGLGADETHGQYHQLRRPLLLRSFDLLQDDNGRRGDTASQEQLQRSESRTTKKSSNIWGPEKNPAQSKHEPTSSREVVVESNQTTITRLSPQSTALLGLQARAWSLCFTRLTVSLAVSGSP